MKKFKSLVLGLTMVSALAMFTACGDVPEPTEDDIMDALVDEEMITKDEAKGEYELKIQEVEFNDDKDRVTVECTLGIENGSVCNTTEYKVKFKLKDDGESWKVRSASEGETTTKLVKGISDEEVEGFIGYDSFTAGDVYIYLSDDETTYEITKHDENLEEMQDVVTVEGTAVSGYKSVAFTVKYTFEYSYGWYEEDFEVVEEEVSYVDGYEMELTTEDIAQALIDEEEYVYVMGYYYNIVAEGEDGANVTDAVVGEIEYDGSYAYVPVTLTLTEDDVTMVLEMTITYYFDSYDKTWSVSWTDMDSLTSYTCDAVGVWNGSDEKNTYVLTVKDTFYTEDDYSYEYLAAEVSVTAADGSTYSYYAYIDEYEPGNMYMSVEAGDWIVEPADTNIWADGFDGYYTEEGVFEGAYSWDKWSFTKQAD